MKIKLETMTDVQLARHFISTNEKSLTCAVRDYLMVSREANRVRAYGIEKYGLLSWQTIVNRTVRERA